VNKQKQATIQRLPVSLLKYYVSAENE